MNLPVPLALGITPSHWRCMNLHLCLTHTQLILHLFVTKCAAGMILPCQVCLNLPVPLALVRLLPEKASFLRNVTISRLATGNLPFLSPANTIVPYITCMIPLLYNALVRQYCSCINLVMINRGTCHLIGFVVENGAHKRLDAGRSRSHQR